eukprot:7798190-Heterocapsa_arctica.AAC.1
MDVYAATASSVSARVLIALAAARRRRGEKVTLLIGDVSTAFLHAPLPPEKKINVIPPATEYDGGALWRLRKALYGLRE